MSLAAAWDLDRLCVCQAKRRRRGETMGERDTKHGLRVLGAALIVGAAAWAAAAGAVEPAILVTPMAPEAAVTAYALGLSSAASSKDIARAWRALPRRALGRPILDGRKIPVLMKEGKEKAAKAELRAGRRRGVAVPRDPAYCTAAGALDLEAGVPPDSDCPASKILKAFEAEARRDAGDASGAAAAYAAVEPLLNDRNRVIAQMQIPLLDPNAGPVPEALLNSKDPKIGGRAVVVEALRLEGAGDGAAAAKRAATLRGNPFWPYAEPITLSRSGQGFASCGDGHPELGLDCRVREITSAAPAAMGARIAESLLVVGAASEGLRAPALLRLGQGFEDNRLYAAAAVHYAQARQAAADRPWRRNALAALIEAAGRARDRRRLLEASDMLFEDEPGAELAPLHIVEAQSLAGFASPELVLKHLAASEPYWASLPVSTRAAAVALKAGASFQLGRDLDGFRHLMADARWLSTEEGRKALPEYASTARHPYCQAASKASAGFLKDKDRAELFELCAKALSTVPELTPDADKARVDAARWFNKAKLPERAKPLLGVVSAHGGAAAVAANYLLARLAIPGLKTGGERASPAEGDRTFAAAHLAWERSSGAARLTALQTLEEAAAKVDPGERGRRVRELALACTTQAAVVGRDDDPANLPDLASGIYELRRVPGWEKGGEWILKQWAAMRKDIFGQIAAYYAIKLLADGKTASENGQRCLAPGEAKEFCAKAGTCTLAPTRLILAGCLRALVDEKGVAEQYAALADPALALTAPDLDRIAVQAQSLAKAGEPGDALRLLDAVLGQLAALPADGRPVGAEQHAKLFYARGEVALRAGKPGEAVAAAEQGLSLAESRQGRGLRGRGLCALGRFEQAEAELRPIPDRGHDEDRCYFQARQKSASAGIRAQGNAGLAMLSGQACPAGEEDCKSKNAESDERRAESEFIDRILRDGGAEPAIGGVEAR